MAEGKLVGRLRSPTLQRRRRKHGNSTIDAGPNLIMHRVADIIRSCLGPKAMLKMLLDPMGGIVLTNDGHAILREIEVAHPAAKSMIELSRTQDEEVGDGTTTVIILGMKMFQVTRKFILTVGSWRDSCSSPSTT
jgi:chaperonin GroEL (HSP60 family)